MVDNSAMNQVFQSLQNVAVLTNVSILAELFCTCCSSLALTQVCFLHKMPSWVLKFCWDPAAVIYCTTGFTRDFIALPLGPISSPEWYILTKTWLPLLWVPHREDGCHNLIFVHSCRDIVLQGSRYAALYIFISLMVCWPQPRRSEKLWQMRDVWPAVSSSAPFCNLCLLVS